MVHLNRLIKKYDLICLIEPNEVDALAYIMLVGFCLSNAPDHIVRTATGMRE